MTPSTNRLWCIGKIEVGEVHCSGEGSIEIRKIVIPETARGTNRPMLRTRTTEGVPIHAGSLDPHQRERRARCGFFRRILVASRVLPCRSSPPVQKGGALGTLSASFSRLKAVSVRLSPSSRGFSIKRGIFGERRVSLFDGGRDMASGQGKDVAFLFADEELSGMTGLKRGADFVEVMCGCTSHRYGDAVGRLRVFASGDLEINCECTPGCEEGELDHLMPRVLMLRKCCLED
ncbi:hypothetical protein BHM03_00018956 [Ensete ventricosum]|nr:hypothetical protein BHM03_00018956 [Ensete ventricosum]